MRTVNTEPLAKKQKSNEQYENIYIRTKTKKKHSRRFSINEWIGGWISIPAM